MSLFRTLALAATAAVGIASAVPAQDTQQGLSQDSVIESIKREGVLKVGMSTFVPWAMRDKNGDLIGFEIDVAKQLAEDMGVEAEFVPTAWDGIIPALLAGKFAPKWNIPLRSLVAAVLGGLLLGYGARLAFGCNIGAYFGGISSGSLHGWLWLVMAFVGNMLGVKLRPFFALAPRKPASRADLA